MMCSFSYDALSNCITVKYTFFTVYACFVNEACKEIGKYYYLFIFYMQIRISL